MTENPQAAMQSVQKHLQEGDNQQALAALRQVVTAAPSFGAAWGNIARLARALQDIDLALQAAEHWRRAAPADVAVYELMFELLSEIGAADRALALMDALVDANPAEPRLLYLHGLALARLGQFERAENAFSMVIGAQPLNALAWEQISIIKRFTADDPDVDNMRAVEQRVPQGTEEHAAMLYALGKAYDDAGDVDQAFAAFDRGARIVASHHPFDVPPLAAHHDRLRTSFSQPFIDGYRGQGAPSERPIFVVGLPRSGTTLIEQILSAHSQLAAGGEMRLLPLAATPLRSLEPVDIERIVTSGGPDPWAAMGDDYLSLLSARFADVRFVTDKGLATHLFVGAIRMMLPEARFIYCQRDPRDVAWSAFRSRFSGGQWWSYDLPTIARYQQVYDGLLGHWRSVVPDDRMLAVRYETLVGDPDAEIARLLDFVGLSHEPACFAPHLNTGAVLTRSLAQVRSPINARSVGGWRRYERHLSPYLDELGRLGLEP